MAKEDEEKTAFITSQGIFCYSKMPFWSEECQSNLSTIGRQSIPKANRQEFGSIRGRPGDQKPHGTRDNEGYRRNVNTKGIKVFLDKVDVVLALPSPKCLKDVQKLNGKLGSLNRFLAKSAEKSLPFFKTLKKCTKKSDFHWTTEVEDAFKQMKKLIAELPIVTTLMEKEDIIVLTCKAAKSIPWFDATNNKAEYEALIAGLRITEQMGMVRYLEKVKALASSFKKFSIKHVPRSENKKADALSKIASTSFAHLTKQVLVEELKEKSINEAEVLAVVEEEGYTL
ncbi:reverse transcriptase domain-containing protein [Tanacetum coccineum]